MINLKIVVYGATEEEATLVAEMAGALKKGIEYMIPDSMSATVESIIISCLYRVYPKRTLIMARN